MVELLVALAIFALIAGFAYRSLQSMLDSRDALQNETRKWRDIALFVGRMDRDLSAVLVTPAAPGITRRMMPISQTVPRTPQTLGEGLVLMRSGSALQENAIAVLGSVTGLDFRFLDPNGEWRRNWTGSPTPAPAAIEVTVKLSSGESITRLVDLPRVGT